MAFKDNCGQLFLLMLSWDFFFKGFYMRHQIVMRNVAVLFITQERLRAEIFIDIVRSSRGTESSVDSEDGFHLQD